MAATKHLIELHLDFGSYADRSVAFNGIKIGTWVTHGADDGSGRTVFASRIYRPSKIEETATTRLALQRKVIAALHRYAKTNALTVEQLSGECLATVQERKI